MNALAAPFSQGRPAISEHLAVLRHAGLVREEPRGRERYYHLDAGPLSVVHDWLAEYQHFWIAKFADLSNHLDKESV